MQANNEKTVIALKAASTEVDVFVGSVLKEVELLEKEYSDIVPDPDSKEGYKFCKEVRKNVLPVKSRMEGARKSLKRPILDMGKLIDSSLNPLASRLEAVYKPFEDAYRKKDNEKKVKEEKRQETITKGFQRLNDSAMEALGQTSIVIESILEDLVDFDFDPDIFMDRTDEAVRKHRELMGNLQNMLTAQIAAEDLQLRQKEIEEKERVIREKKEDADKKARELKELAAQKIRDDEIRKQALVDAKEKHDQELLKLKQDAEQDKIDAKAKEEQDKKDAKQAEFRRVLDLEKAKDDAARDERLRIEADKEKEIAANKKLEDNKRHRAKIHKEIFTAIMAKLDVPEDDVRAIIKLVAKRNAGPIGIIYSNDTSRIQ